MRCNRHRRKTSDTHGLGFWWHIVISSVQCTVVVALYIHRNTSVIVSCYKAINTDTKSWNHKHINRHETHDKETPHACVFYYEWPIYMYSPECDQWDIELYFISGLLVVQRMFLSHLTPTLWLVYSLYCNTVEWDWKWLTGFLQCFYTVGWVIWPFKEGTLTQLL